MAMWVRGDVALAPCQCFSPIGTQIMSPCASVLNLGQRIHLGFCDLGGAPASSVPTSDAFLILLTPHEARLRTRLTQ